MHNIKKDIIYKIKQKHTKHTTVHIMIQNRTKKYEKKMTNLTAM